MGGRANRCVPARQTEHERVNAIIYRPPGWVVSVWRRFESRRGVFDPAGDYPNPRVAFACHFCELLFGVFDLAERFSYVDINRLGTTRP